MCGRFITRGATLGKGDEKAFLIGVVAVDRLAAITTIHHVVDISAVSDAQRAEHGRALSRREIGVNTTDCPFIDSSFYEQVDGLAFSPRVAQFSFVSVSNAYEVGYSTSIATTSALSTETTQKTCHRDSADSFLRRRSSDRPSHLVGISLTLLTRFSLAVNTY